MIAAILLAQAVGTTSVTVTITEEALALLRSQPGRAQIVVNMGSSGTLDFINRQLDLERRLHEASVRLARRYAAVPQPGISNPGHLPAGLAMGQGGQPQQQDLYLYTPAGVQGHQVVLQSGDHGEDGRLDYIVWALNHDHQQRALSERERWSYVGQLYQGSLTCQLQARTVLYSYAYSYTNTDPSIPYAYSYAYSTPRSNTNPNALLYSDPDAYAATLRTRD